VAREKPVQGADTNRSAPFDQPRLYLDQRHVGLFGHQFADECALRLNPGRVPVSAAWLATACPCSRASCRQRIALDTLTPKRPAAARQLKPPSIAETTLSRRSCESERAIHAGLLRQQAA
jgi:hypothetical protein